MIEAASNVPKKGKCPITAGEDVGLCTMGGRAAGTRPQGGTGALLFLPGFILHPVTKEQLSPDSLSASGEPLNRSPPW